MQAHRAIRWKNAPNLGITRMAGARDERRKSPRERRRGRYGVSSAASFSGSTRSSFVTRKASNVLAEADGGAPCPQSESRVPDDPMRRPGLRPHPQDTGFN